MSSLFKNHGLWFTINCAVGCANLFFAAVNHADYTKRKVYSKVDKDLIMNRDNYSFMRDDRDMRSPSKYDD